MPVRELSWERKMIGLNVSRATDTKKYMRKGGIEMQRNKKFITTNL